MNSNACGASECSGNRSKRSNTSGGASSRTPPSASRIGGVSINRTPVYIDDATINTMMANPQFLPNYFPHGRINRPPIPSQHETYGSPIDYNLGWMPKDVNLSDFIDPTQESTRYGKFAQNNSLSANELADGPTQADPRFMLNRSLDETSRNPQSGASKQESIIEWFDRTVESELKKRRESNPGSQISSIVDPALIKAKARHTQNLTKSVLERMSEASASRIEIASQMRMQPDTELTDAVDKLAKAEAMCVYAGAVEAAEAAAEAAPPGLAEEAAVASARVFQTTTTEIRETIPGTRPVEVIGYVGVTKPKHPKKS